MQSIKSFWQVHSSLFNFAQPPSCDLIDMFSCSNAKDHISGPQVENPDRNTSLQHPSNDQNTPSSLSDREMLDRVLEEGIKLKKRCKQLRISLMESENKRSEEQLAFNKRLNIAESALQSTVSEMKAQHFLELTHVRESRLFELENLSHQVQALQLEKQQTEEMITQLKNRVFQLQDEKRDFQLQKNEFQSFLNSSLEQDKNKHAQEVADWKLRVQEKVKEVEFLQQEKSAFQLRVAQLELQIEEMKQDFACPDCEQLKLDYSQQKIDFFSQTKAQKVEFSALQSQLEEMRFQHQKSVDEKVYFAEENARLEKQVWLMKSEMERAKKEGNGKEGTKEGDFRGVLKNEKEQRELPFHFI